MDCQSHFPSLRFWFSRSFSLCLYQLHFYVLSSYFFHSGSYYLPPTAKRLGEHMRVSSQPAPEHSLSLGKPPTVGVSFRKKNIIKSNVKEILKPKNHEDQNNKTIFCLRIRLFGGLTETSLNQFEQKP